MVELDYSSLGKAISQLKAGIQMMNAEPQNTLLRDGVIQRFEFTYGLSHKMLQRFLALTAPNPEEFKEMSFPALIRSGSEKGLLFSGWDKWFYFREARNLTSHTYDERKALEVIERVPEFLLEAEFLYEQLQQRSR